MSPNITRRTLITGAAGAVAASRVLKAQKPIPDKLVILTFDDGPVSHTTIVAPLLRKYGFTGTFFVCEFPPHFDDKTLYMSWEQIADLHQQGFEVANHTIRHNSVGRLTPGQFAQAVTDLEEKAIKYGIPGMVSFAYPGYDYNDAAIKVLKDKGYLYARAGLDRICDPRKDDRYIIPGLTITANNRDAVMNLFQSARNGNIAVLTVHGVPDKEHPWVNTPPELFEEYLRFLSDNKFQVIAMRDLAQYLPSA